MIEAPIGIRIMRGKTRCHPYITDLQTFYAVTSAALRAQVGLEPQSDASLMVLAAHAANADVGLPLLNYLQAAVTGEPPEEIIVRIDEKLPEPEGVTVAGMESVSMRIVAAIFSLFIEGACDWFKRTYGKQVADWPQTANFCRVVRNALVHGGTINLSSETATGGQWRHLKYDHRDNGRKILNEGGLSLGDLIILMLEMEMELNDAGAPFDLG
jgi:hypothetical protein